MLKKLVSLIIIFLLSPLLLIISVVIIFYDGTPIFFKQKRLGKNNKTFLIYKFRTMKKDTPNIASHHLKSSESFLIKSGKTIRKYSLDELPQLINIFLGDMNFIGPRPALFNQKDLINARNSHGIETLKPGLTGWAQINGRDNLSISEKVELDLFYLKNRSIFMDIKIFLLTIKKVILADDIL